MNYGSTAVVGNLWRLHPDSIQDARQTLRTQHANRKQHGQLAMKSARAIKFQKDSAYRAAGFRETARRDFLRFAVGRLTAPTLTALSNAEWTPGRSLAASSLLPATTAARNCFSSRRSLDLTLLFWRFLRLLLRIRRSADFVFGINSMNIFSKEPLSLLKRDGKSTSKKDFIPLYFWTSGCLFVASFLPWPAGSKS